MEKFKNLFDVIGPVIIGPSSSHTAGAVRLGLLAGRIFGEKPEKVKFVLYNSFAKTGKGHGTDKGLLAGILGFNVDDSKIKDSFELAKNEGVNFEFEFIEDYNRHPNAVDIILEGSRTTEVAGISAGAGEVRITKINGYNFNLDGTYETLLLIYKDKPGMIYRVTALLQNRGINVASMHCDRNAKGEEASMGICVDAPIPQNIVEELKRIDEMYTVRNIEKLKND